MIQRVAQALVAELRHIQNDAESFHLLQQLASFRAQITSGVRSICVSPRPVVRWPYGTQPLRVRALEMRGGHDRVRAFEAQDVSDGLLVAGGWPLASHSPAARFAP